MAAFNDPPVVDYLPRPFTLAGLLERIQSAVANKGRREPSNLDRGRLIEDKDIILHWISFFRKSHSRKQFYWGD